MRKAGVLLAIFSLPGSFKIGDLGESAYQWLDLLKANKVSLWQILPLNPVGYGNSPYQAYSAFAGDEIYISIEKLYKSLNLELDHTSLESSYVDYKEARKLKEKYLYKAFKHFKKNNDYYDFNNKAFWLDDYVEFMALKNQNDNKPWTEWKEFKADKRRMDYHRFLQFIFFQQWQSLKNKAKANGVEIIGDIPIYLGHDSAEVYNNQSQFTLNKDGSLAKVAGVPPDYFSENGQLWGNPLYNWIEVAKDNYQLWIDRLKWNQEMFDLIRLDHFRGFDTYWEVDAEEKTAKNGIWRLGPSHAFFNKMYEEVKALNLIVEDLGELRAEVLQIRDDFNLPGMQVIQFLLSKKEIKQIKSKKDNYLVYSGTHDNPPLSEVVDNLELKQRQELFLSLELYSKSLRDNLVYFCLSLDAKWAIIPIQDLIDEDSNSRINTPGTIGSPNWEY